VPRKPEPRTVHCAGCGRAQPDLGKRVTCPYCGVQPVPSYSYSKDSGFYPKPRPLTAKQLVRRHLA